MVVAVTALLAAGGHVAGMIVFWLFALLVFFGVTLLTGDPPGGPMTTH